MKIVSLLPAATEILDALGLADSLVGRSHECDYPAGVAKLPALTKARVDSSLPSEELDRQVRDVVTQRLPIYMLDEARLAALAPDVVVTQAACEVCAIAYDQVKGALRRTAPTAVLVSLQPARLGDVLANVTEVAAACDVPERGRSVLRELEQRLAAASSRVTAAKPRVAVVEWLAPLMLAGHWVPEVIERAGAVSVGPRPGAMSPYASWEELHALKPDAIVVAPCGFDLQRTLAETAPFADRLRLLSDRVLFMDGNAYLNRPGPRLVDAVETIAGWLRGDSVAPERGVAGVALRALLAAS
jgi:iron complex transport system substrate-binding protein